MEPFVIRFLENKRELQEAGEILYSVYCKELLWNFGKNTPFRIRVEKLPNGKQMLIDDHHYSCKWIGTFFHQRLVGCLCIFFRVGPKHQVQTQYYQKNNRQLNKLLKKEKKLIEAGRAAILKEFRGSNALFLKMFALLFTFSIENDYSVFFTTGIPSLVDLFKELEIPAFPELKFKYEKQDQEYVTPFLARFKNKKTHKVLKNINKLCEPRLCTSGGIPPLYFNN